MTRMEIRLRCFDRSCQEPVRHRLLDLSMCTTHYIEALEHGAHIVLLSYKEREPERQREAAIAKTRAELLSQVTEQRAEEKREREELTGQPELVTVRQD